MGVIADLLAVNALFRLRAAQGVLGLEAKHGADRLENACARDLEVGDPSCRTIKGILAARAESQPAAPSTGDGGAAASSTSSSSVLPAHPFTPPQPPRTRKHRDRLNRPGSQCPPATMVGMGAPRLAQCTTADLRVRGTVEPRRWRHR